MRKAIHRESLEEMADESKGWLEDYKDFITAVVVTGCPIIFVVTLLLAGLRITQLPFQIIMGIGVLVVVTGILWGIVSFIKAMFIKTWKDGKYNRESRKRRKYYG